MHSFSFMPFRSHDKAFLDNDFMLPDFIIEQIIRRERENRQDRRPQLEISIPVPIPRRDEDIPEEDKDRGTITIELV